MPTRSPSEGIPVLDDKFSPPQSSHDFERKADYNLETELYGFRLKSGFCPGSLQPCAAASLEKYWFEGEG
jgi:hypothetical protein